MPSATVLQSVSINMPDAEVHMSSTNESQRDRLSSPNDITDIRVSYSDDRQLAKDTRSYEHNRQRVKKAAMLVKRKACKEHGFARTVCPSLPFSSEKEKRLRADEVDPLLDVKVPDVEFTKNTDPNSLPARIAAYKREVKIWDLIIARRPRKCKQGDFEVIPGVRSVIVLDDFGGEDLEMDEPWEYLHEEGKQETEPVKKSSYAQVLSFTK